MTDAEIKSILDSLVKFGEPVKVKLSVINKQRGSAESKDHETHSIITGCQQTIGWPVSKVNGRYVDIFQSEEERKDFEKRLGLKEGELNVFVEASLLKWPSRFQNQIKLTREGVEFDLRSPMDYIKYRLAALSPKVAKSIKDLEYRKAECEYIFENKQAEAAATNKTNRNKLKSTAMLAAILDDPKKKKDLYKVLFQTEVPKDFTQEMLENALMKINEDNPEKVISTLEDPDFQTKLLVFEAIRSGEIVIRGKGYYLSHNDKVVIATNRGALVDWFKNKENNAEIIRIKSVIEAKNK